MMHRVEMAPTVIAEGGSCSHRRNPQDGPKHMQPLPVRQRLSDVRVRWRSASQPAPCSMRPKPIEKSMTARGGEYSISKTKPRRRAGALSVRLMKASVPRSWSARSQVRIRPDGTRRDVLLMADYHTCRSGALSLTGYGSRGACVRLPLKDAFRSLH